MGGQNPRNPRRRRTLPAADPPALQKALDPGSQDDLRPSKRGGRGGHPSDVLMSDDDVVDDARAHHQHQTDIREEGGPGEETADECGGKYVCRWQTFHHTPQAVARHLQSHLGFRFALPFVNKHGVDLVNLAIEAMDNYTGLKNPAGMFNWAVTNYDEFTGGSP